MNRASRQIAPLFALSLIAAGPPDLPDAAHLPSHPGLPDPLVRFDGTPVVNRDDWRNIRRPELKGLFEHYMYGRSPVAAQVLASTERIDAKSYGGKATTKEVELTVGPDAGVKIHLLVVVPNRRTGPAPVFLGTNFHGNHAASSDPNVRLSTAWMPESAPGCKDHRATEASRGTDAGVWSIEESIDRGYAVATF